MNQVLQQAYNSQEFFNMLNFFQMWVKKSKKEKTHQPSRSSEGCKGVDAEHNDMRRREKQGKHRESKKSHLKVFSCSYISLLFHMFFLNLIFPYFNLSLVSVIPVLTAQLSDPFIVFFFFYINFEPKQLDSPQRPHSCLVGIIS